MHITKEQFEARFVPLVMSGGSFLKKSGEDQNIMLVSASLTLEPGQRYSEAELNDTLKPWCATFGEGFGLDHVTIRRHLVDQGYLLRDKAGTHYELNGETPATTFDAAIAELDHELMLENAVREREERRRKYTQSS